MSTIAMEQNQNNNFIIWIIIIVLCVTGIMFAVSYSNHAVERHGSAALLVRECMENQGPVASFHNPETKRDAHIVCLDNRQFGIQVCDKNDCEVTSFVKNKMKRLEDIFRYLSNRNYIRIK